MSSSLYRKQYEVDAMSIDNDNNSLEKVLVEGAEEMWNQNHESFTKRNLTGEEACKEAYKMGIRRVLFEIWGIDYPYQYLSYREKQKKLNEISDEGDDIK